MARSRCPRNRSRRLPRWHRPRSSRRRPRPPSRRHLFSGCCRRWRCRLGLVMRNAGPGFVPPHGSRARRTPPSISDGPAPASLLGLRSGTAIWVFDERAVSLGQRVSGQFSGTTDEILQWGACKWGFDEELVRGEAFQLSDWRQDNIGTWTSDLDDCPSDAPTRSGRGSTECPETYGLYQIMWHWYPDSWPMIRDATAFHVDFALGLRRVASRGGRPTSRTMLPRTHPTSPGMPGAAGARTSAGIGTTAPPRPTSRRSSSGWPTDPGHCPTSEPGRSARR